MLDVTQVMVNEHKLILRMITLVEKNTELMELGKFRDWQFFLDAVDFIRNFADRFHHAKEEDVLFDELVKNGMPKENSPVAAMLINHDQGRAFVRGMDEAAQKAMDGESGQIPIIAENGRGYAELLREHIDKEDNILYPLAEKVLPADVRQRMVDAYATAEATLADDLSERYTRMVEHYEQAAAA